MTVFHISPVYNRDSIQANGIIPTKVKNPSHLKRFKELGLTTKDDKAIYTWESHYDNEKIISDLVYSIVWIHPRNDIFGNFFDRFNDYFDFKKIHRNPIWNYDQMLFDIYAVDVEDSYSLNYHIQSPYDDKYGTACLMHERFSHDDKKLHIFNKPIKKFRRINSQSVYYFDKANKKFSIKII